MRTTLSTAGSSLGVGLSLHSGVPPPAPKSGVAPARAAADVACDNLPSPPLPPLDSRRWEFLSTRHRSGHARRAYCGSEMMPLFPRPRHRPRLGCAACTAGGAVQTVLRRIPSTSGERGCTSAATPLAPPPSDGQPSLTSHRASRQPQTEAARLRHR